MGHRLSKIYTRTGDDGTTGLGDGNRVAKDHPRVEAMGAVDELNSVLGLLLTESLPQSIEMCLHRVQHTLFDIGGELAIPGYVLVKQDQPGTLEQMLDTLNADLAPLKEFILPGGSRAAACCHLARSVCRRAERRVHTLAGDEEVSAVSRQYLNRLSDLLFVVARSLNRAERHADVLWRHERGSKE